MVTDSKGLIPTESSNLVEVAASVSGVSPSQGLNPFGGTYLEITGSSFPQSLTDGTVAKVEFVDATHVTQCPIISTSSTKIVCLPDAFDISTSSATLRVTINGKVDSSNSVTVSSSPAVVSSITPSSVSPVLKQILTI